MSETKPTIVFFGTPDFAVPSLRALAKAGLTPRLVVTKPDQPRGRGRILTLSPVKKAALELNVKVVSPLKLDDPFLQQITEIQPDLLVVVAYGKILPAKLLAIPHLGSLNVHPSLLPKYRGPTPIPNAILSGDDKTGVTIMELDQEMDHGPILLQESVVLSNQETAGSLSKILSELGAKLLIKAIPLYLQGKIKARSQLHQAATYCRLLEKEAGRLDWTLPALALERQIRAFQPWPGAYATWAGQRVNLLQVKITTESLPVGEIKVDRQRLLVGTGTTALEVLELQPAGKRSMSAKAWLAGRPFLRHPKAQITP